MTIPDPLAITMTETDSSQGAEILEPISPDRALQTAWLQRHIDLLAAEREEEHAQSRLLLSRSAPKLLEREGLALLGLGVVGVRIGLGAQTLVELERPAAYHASQLFPPHTLRPGDLALIEDNNSALSGPGTSARSSGGGKGAKQGSGANAGSGSVQGVVYRVSDTRIILAVGGKRSRGRKSNGLEAGTKEAGHGRDARTGATQNVSTDELELPERVRVVKVANDATYDRMENTLERLGKQLGVAVRASKDGSQNESDEDDDTPATDASAPQTIDNAVPFSSGCNPLLSSLLGLSAPTWSAPDQHGAAALPLPPFNQSLNEPQLHAISFALRANHFALVHGPPGTGKTTAVAELVLQLVLGQGKRVLVCGASNLAVDNLLERILGRAEQRDALKKAAAGVTRLGHPARVLPSLVSSTLDAQSSKSDEGALVRDVKAELEAHMSALHPSSSSSSAPGGNTSGKSGAQNKSHGPSTGAGNKSTRGAPRLRGAERRARWEEVHALRKEYRAREGRVTRSVLSHARIVLSTCHGAGSRQLHRESFDVVIIDEACQALEAACWIPIMKVAPGGKIVLAGDHLQLPPTVKGVTKSTSKSGGKTRGPQSDKSQGKNKEATATKTKASKDEHNDQIPHQPDDSLSDSSSDEAVVSTFSPSPSSRKHLHRPKLRPPRTLETTLFSRLLGLYGDGCKALLSVQYRMNKEIMSFPSTTLYEGRLEAHESCVDGRLTDLEGFGQEQNEKQSVEQEEEEEERWNAPVVFIDTAGADMYEKSAEDENGGSAKVGKRGPSAESKSNENEAELVVKHVELLVSHGLPASSIAVIAPYSAQVSLLSSLLRPAHPELEIGTVDGMQGREKEAVIITLVRSNDKNEVGFLAEKRRLNVAMTRPKKHLAIIGDSSTVGSSGSDFLARWTEHLESTALVEMAGMMDA